MNLKVWVLFFTAITFSLSSGFMERRPLKEAVKPKIPKIVYIGVDASSKTDTYPAYPFFMQLLSKQYPGLCRTINFGIGWKYEVFPEGLLLQRDATLNAQNFFIIDQDLELEASVTLNAFLRSVLEKGGVVILGKFTGESFHRSLGLSLVYSWLYSLHSNAHRHQLFLFSTLPDFQATLYWKGESYLIYEDMLATERSLAPLKQRNQKKTHLIELKQYLANSVASLLQADGLRDNVLEEEDKKMLSIPEKTVEQLIDDVEHKPIAYPKTALEDANTLVIDVAKDVTVKKDGIFKISDVYFLNETLKNLDRSLRLIALVANTR